MIYTNRFFHLPSLYVYLLAAVLLVTSVFHAAAIVRHGLYVVFNLNEQIARPYVPDHIQLTPDAEAYMIQQQNQWQRSNDMASLIRSAILLFLSLGFFAFFWRSTGRVADLDMTFSVRNFYFFAVSAISFLIFFYALSAGVGTAVGTAYRPNQYYFDLYSVKPVPPPGQTSPPKVTVTLDDLKEQLNKQEENYKNNMGRSDTRRMVDQLTAAVVALPIFYWHSKRMTTL
jgi:hypothetical protein